MSFLNNGITGHRGDLQHHAENTLEGFQAAIELGVDWLETDLRVTRDNIIVLSHDEHTGNYAEKKLFIHETEFSELRRLNTSAMFNLSHPELPERNTRIPTLAEAMELVKGQTETRLSLQPKVDCIELAAHLIREMKFQPWTGFNDGNFEFMQRAGKEIPEAVIFYDIYKTEQLEQRIAEALANKFHALVANEAYLSKSDIFRIQEAGLVPGVWTVNNPGEMERFLALGVRRFYTDFPEILLKKVKPSF